MKHTAKEFTNIVLRGGKYHVVISQRYEMVVGARGEGYWAFEVTVNDTDFNRTYGTIAEVTIAVEEFMDHQDRQDYEAGSVQEADDDGPHRTQGRPEAYEHVRAWARLNSIDINMMRSARDDASWDNAPLDAVYIHPYTGNWVTFRDLVPARQEEVAQLLN